MKKIEQKLIVNNEKTVLSGKISVYKTEHFIRTASFITDVDAFLSKVAESIILNVGKLLPYASSDGAFLIEPETGVFRIFFKFGTSIKSKSAIKSSDIVFYKFVRSDGLNKKNDRILSIYLERNSTFTLSVKTVMDKVDDCDFDKLYVLSGTDGVNFPLLTPTQQQIVETENRNVLVQGVAGSGKTNVCIDKIVFCACRNYFGKVLYTTFSRGLIIETKTRVDVFCKRIVDFIKQYDENKVVFADDNHKKALENRLGIYFDTSDDDKIIDKLHRIVDFLKNKVDYRLIEDFYQKGKSGGEKYFSDTYLKSGSFRLSGTLEKVKHLPIEVIYKEIYGMIFGTYNLTGESYLSLAEYTNIRSAYFSKIECDAIYTLALDYAKTLEKNDLLDNNLLSRKLLESGAVSEKYSLAIVDEVQDFTQVNLAFIKSISRKMFCVGDALQMINPSYFSFAYLKRLMYEKDLTSVSELKHNYRNSEKIERIIDALGELNVKYFGTHNFVIKGESIKSDLPTGATFVKEKDLINKLSTISTDNVTIVVASNEKKGEVKKILPKTEVLTVSEIKGLERKTVILIDIISDNNSAFHKINTINYSRKQADENSVYRYYFNLFYVGLSRATQYLIVAESAPSEIFDGLFNTHFDKKNANETLKLIDEISVKTEISDDEIIKRIREFLSLGQYDNALFTADRLSIEELRQEEITRINIEKEYVQYGDYRGAGMEFWRKGMLEDAKKYFHLNNDEALCNLIDACSEQNTNLDINIVDFLPLLSDNEVALDVINDTVWRDYNEIMDTQKAINEKLKSIKKTLK